MQMSQLSKRSGVPIPTIKYYLREGLLPPGTATAATRAEYGESHLRRLRLIRALLEIGELPVTSIQRIVGALDDETVSLHELIGRVQYALGPHVTEPEDDPDWQAASGDVDALITELGWQVRSDSPARPLLGGALVALRRLDSAPAGPSLHVYAETLGRLAALEVASVDLPGGAAGPAAGAAVQVAGEADRTGDEPGRVRNEAGRASGEPDQAGGAAGRAAVVESAVAGMVLYERVMIALRRMAQESMSARRFGGSAAD
jgi:DNA-binding transcriptional MerR regulator